MANHPTGPLPTEQSAQRSQSGLPAAQATPSLLETGRHRAFTPPLSELSRANEDEGEEEYELKDEPAAMEDSHQRLPAPEPEPQASPQRPGGQQRHVRRLDRGAGSDVTRGNRNGSPGDAIDIPAFLRKR